MKLNIRKLNETKKGVDAGKGRAARPKKLRHNILRLLILGWLLPLSVLSGSVFLFVSHELERKTRLEIQEAAESAVKVCEMRLLSAVQASRNASYLPTVKEIWKTYMEDGNGLKLHSSIYEFLSQNYRYDEKFLSTNLYYSKLPNEIFSVYSSIADSDYDSVRFFSETGKAKVDALAERLDTRIGFTSVDGHLYMVRNIVNKDYSTLATIVMELNKNMIFQSLRGVGWYEDVCVLVDGECIYADRGEAVDLAAREDTAARKSSVYYEKDGCSYVTREKNLEGHWFRYTVLLNYDSIHYERRSMKYLVILSLLFTIPLVFIIFRFLYRNVNDPVTRLIRAANEVEKGHFGYQIKYKEKSEEFSYLTGAFNSMSDKLKNQFEQIYLEELALKDADIKALQSQINPHFLNNTLEIINWEARMSGNEKVSNMIEALSTMLEATLNRKKQPMIPLSEELDYVDAYCYIIRQRFGDKLEFEKRIDQTLLREEVPRLIIQPIIENAVEHGLAGRQGKIRIRIYSERDKLKIEVVNDGVLTEKDRQRIDMLLNEKGDSERSVSLGICNVNKRLKIIYGPDCGLTIRSDNEGCTVSTITVKLHK